MPYRQTYYSNLPQLRTITLALKELENKCVRLKMSLRHLSK